MIDDIAQAGDTLMPAVSSPRSATLAVVASGASRKSADPVVTKLPPYAYQADIDPSTARIVKELLAQSHQIAKVQPGINRL